MRDDSDPQAKRRRTRKEVRHDLIKRAFDAYMKPHPRVPEFRRTTTEAVRQIKEGWKDRFGVELTEHKGNVDIRKTYHALERGYLDADKFGRQWVSTPRRILAAFMGTGGAK